MFCIKTNLFSFSAGQLFNDNSHLLNYKEFLSRFNIPITPKEFAIVFDAIPSGVRLLQYIPHTPLLYLL